MTKVWLIGYATLDGSVVTQQSLAAERSLEELPVKARWRRTIVAKRMDEKY